MRPVLFGCAIAALVGAPAFAGPNEDALMAADKAFEAMSEKDGGAKAFIAYAAPDARVLDGEEKTVSGKDGIAAYAKENYPEGSKLTWVPKEAVASADGTMGFTVGRWVFVSPPGKDGKTMSIKGSYVTVWSEQPDGSYKYSLDTGSPDAQQ